MKNASFKWFDCPCRMPFQGTELREETFHSNMMDSNRSNILKKYVKSARTRYINYPCKIYMKWMCNNPTNANSGCPNSSPKSLQLIQNAATRVLTGPRKRADWLLITGSLFNAELVLINQAPSHLKHLIVPSRPNSTLLSDCWVFKSAPNHLPNQIQAIDTPSIFKIELETFLFGQACS